MGDKIQLADRLQLHSILPSLSAALVLTMISVTLAVSFAALVFAGELAPYLAYGIGIALFATAVIGGIMALLSSHVATIAQPQGVTSTLLALIASTIVLALPAEASANARFATVAVAIAIAAVGTGIFLAGLGVFRLGDLIRYIPYPVIGGFVAGINLLLVQGSMRVITGTPLRLSTLPIVTQLDAVVRWLPALLFGLALLIVLRRYKHTLLLPGMLLGAFLLFWAILFVAGVHPQQAMADGWLLGPLPSGALWQGLPWEALSETVWSGAFKPWAAMATIILVSAVSLLLAATAFELAAQEDMDLNQELRAVGLANIVGGLGGGMVGFHSLGLSGLNLRMGGTSRWAGLLAALFTGLFLLVGPAALAYAPRPVLGGVLLYLGFNALTRWVIDAHHELPITDYLLVLIILAVIALVGLLEGVIAGALIAIVLFVVSYSRINVIKHALSGAQYHSNVDRSREKQRYLLDQGESIAILKLQSFIFFGTAYKLLQQVKAHRHDPQQAPPQFVILDFLRVNGTDTSAAVSFSRLRQLAEKEDFVLVLTHLPPSLARQLQRGGFHLDESAHLRRFPDLDRGIEWCEDQILADADLRRSWQALPLTERLAQSLPPNIAAERLLAYMERREIAPGTAIIRRGDAPNNLYFVETGQVTVSVDLEDGSTLRLRTMGPGTVVGELGLYSGQERTAAVSADVPTIVYRLSASALARMEQEAPDAAAAFHKFIILILVQRLRDTNRALEAMTD